MWVDQRTVIYITIGLCAQSVFVKHSNHNLSALSVIYCSSGLYSLPISICPVWSTGAIHRAGNLTQTSKWKQATSSSFRSEKPGTAEAAEL